MVNEEYYMEKKFEKLTGVVLLDMAEVNDYVQFGKFAWQVIGIEDGKKLLISKECMQIDFDWELAQDDSSETNENIEDMLADILYEKGIDYAAEFNKIKKYFSEWFCEKYFSAEDLTRIVPNCNRHISENPEYVFILSEEEVRKYIPKKEDRIATINVILNNVKRPWLLRVDGTADYQISVDTEGEIVKVPKGQICDKFRPAIWVK